ncbi:MAG: hypothetical protein LBI39_03710 [Puniceicoccales bacterium]|jgi:hypothetical protein|nr:hypothetical protein [Puniceicoccales bacterium]
MSHALRGAETLAILLYGQIELVAVEPTLASGHGALPFGWPNLDAQTKFLGQRNGGGTLNFDKPHCGWMTPTASENVRPARIAVNGKRCRTMAAGGDFDWRKNNSDSTANAKLQP